MIDKKDIKKMWVWDSDRHKEEEKGQRYVVFKSKYGYYAIDEEHENAFEDDKEYNFMNIIHWNHAEEIN